jgi:hypothetical protein
MGNLSRKEKLQLVLVALGIVIVGDFVSEYLFALTVGFFFESLASLLLAL